MDIIILFACLIIKHFIVDFPLQTEYMYTNKGKWFHLGGIYHSLQHIVFTALVVVFCIAFGLVNINISLYTVAIICIVEFIIHYITDLYKVQITSKLKLSSMGIDDDGFKCLRIYSNKYFILFGIDQTIHMMTYVLIIMLML